ncbi:MAG: helix-turn-helix domain-containing protein [Candidatus Aenigmatarchaeota archaeon]
MSAEEIKSLLKQAGLTEYEARACLALVRFGKSRADKISSAEDIPLPRVYDTMSSLVRRGLVAVSRTRPQTFMITDFKRFFNILKNDEARKTEKKIKEIDKISSDFMKLSNSLKIAEPKEEKEDILSYSREMNINEVWEEVQNQTKKEFLVFAGDLSWVSSRSNDIKKLIKKGVDYRILWSKPEKEILPNVRKALKLGIKLRCYNDASNRLRAIISDGKKISLIRKTLKPGVVAGAKPPFWSEDIADYSGVLITSGMVTKVFRDYFYLLWESSMPADKFIKKFKK